MGAGDSFGEQKMIYGSWRRFKGDEDCFGELKGVL